MTKHKSENPEQVLRDQSYLLHETQRLARLGSYVFDVKEGSWESSEILDEIFGIPADFPKTVAGWLQIIHPDEQKGMAEYLSGVLGGIQKFNRQYRIVRVKDGVTRWVHGMGLVESDGAGKPTRMIGTIQDISLQKDTEHALEKRIIALSNPIGIEGDIRFEDLFDLEEIQKIQDAFAQATGVASIITDVEGRPITRPSNFCNLCENVIRKTVKGLENCYQSDKAIGKMNPSGPIVQPCLSGGLLDGGTSICVGDKHIANWLVGQVLDDTDEKSSATNLVKYAKKIGADEKVFEAELRNVTRMSQKQFAAVCNALYLIAGQLSKMAIQNLQQAKYISERRKAEEALQVSENKLRELLENVHLLAVTLDTNGSITYCNDYLLKLTGWKSDEVIGRSWFSVFVPSAEAAEVRRIFKNGIETGVLLTHYENSILNRDQSLRMIAWNNTILHAADGTVSGVASLGIDLSDKINLENQLRQSQKMEAVGLLAGGVAHDFNNLLMVISGYCDLLQTRIGNDDPIRNSIDQISAAATRAAQLTQSLLAFSRKQVLNLQVSDLNTVVSNFQKLIQRVIGEDVHLKSELFPSPVMSMVDAGQIEQVLINLATNARDAMPHGGSLTVRTEVREVVGELANRQGFGKAGMYAVITVGDSGVGMDESVQKKIFDPFFTTKSIGKGTGLGLSIVYGIIKQHNGSIYVFSQPNVGTRFEIYLPIADQNKKGLLQGENGPHSNSDSDVNRGSETILIAEDESALRELIASGLQTYGYRVIQAKNGGEAVDIFAQNKDSIDLVLMDVIMPVKTGREACEEIRRIKPTAKVIFMSGYTADAIQTRGDLLPGVKLMMKPIRSAELVRQMRILLDAK